MRFNLGIGDILITKMIFDEHNINDLKFNINVPHILRYRGNSQQYVDFVIKLSHQLFGKENIIINENQQTNEPLFDNTNFQLHNLNLSKYFKIKNILEPGYIVFHTKCRLGLNRELYDSSYEDLKSFLTNFKSDKKIVILGEKTLSYNQEVAAHGMFTIYEDLLRLNNNNLVLDMAEEALNNTPDWETFIRDISVISNADLNVGVGVGGNFVMCSAFSDNNSFFVTALEQNIKNFSKFCYTNLEEWKNSIK